MSKTVRYGVEIRTITGEIISTADHVTQAEDQTSIEEVQERLARHFAANVFGAKFADIGPARSTHAGIAGWVYTMVNVRHIESYSVWAEFEPQHAATPAAPATEVIAGYAPEPLYPDPLGVPTTPPSGSDPMGWSGDQAA